MVNYIQERYTHSSRSSNVTLVYIVELNVAYCVVDLPAGVLYSIGCCHRYAATVLVAHHLCTVFIIYTTSAMKHVQYSTHDMCTANAYNIVTFKCCWISYYVALDTHTHTHSSTFGAIAVYCKWHLFVCLHPLSAIL